MVSPTTIFRVASRWTTTLNTPGGHLVNQMHAEVFLKKNDNDKLQWKAFENNLLVRWLMCSTTSDVRSTHAQVPWSDQRCEERCKTCIRSDFMLDKLGQQVSGRALTEINLPSELPFEKKKPPEFGQKKRSFCCPLESFGTTFRPQNKIPPTGFH